MAFEGLSEKLQNAFKNLRSKGKLTEDDVKEALKEVKMALLEADVNFKVVKNFVKTIEEKCIGTEVLNGLNPSQTVIKIVNDELTLNDPPKMVHRSTELPVSPEDVRQEAEFAKNVLKELKTVGDILDYIEEHYDLNLDTLQIINGETLAVTSLDYLPDLEDLPRD